MTFHSTSDRKPKGSVTGDQKSPRLAVSYDPEDMEVAVWLAEKKGIPLAQVMRDALYSYLLPFRNNPKDRDKMFEADVQAVQGKLQF